MNNSAGLYNPKTQKLAESCKTNRSWVHCKNVEQSNMLAELFITKINQMGLVLVGLIEVTGSSISLHYYTEQKL